METTNKTKAESLAPAQNFVEIRDPQDGSLLFRYDPQRQLVDIRKRKVVRLVDLAQYSRLTLRLPQTLHTQLADLAATEGGLTVLSGQ